MRRILGPLALLHLAAPLLVSLAMTGCATSLPPAVQVQDVKSIAGKWQGMPTSRAGSAGYALTSREGGSTTRRLTPVN